MGNTWSRGGGQQQQQLNVEEQQQQHQGVEAVHRGAGGSGVKRSHAEENDEDEIDTLMRTPKKKKLKTTSR